MRTSVAAWGHGKKVKRGGGGGGENGGGGEARESGAAGGKRSDAISVLRLPFQRRAAARAAVG